MTLTPGPAALHNLGQSSRWGRVEIPRNIRLAGSRVVTGVAIVDVSSKGDYSWKNFICRPL